MKANAGAQGFTLIEVMVSMGLASVLLVAITISARGVFSACEAGFDSAHVFTEVSAANLWLYDSTIIFAEDTDISFSAPGSSGNRNLCNAGVATGEGILLFGLQDCAVSDVLADSRAYLMIEPEWSAPLNIKLKWGYRVRSKDE